MRKKLGIYIHVPFCVSKCMYCGFYSKGESTPDEHMKWRNSVVGDIRKYGEVYKNKYAVDSVFVGGGTPSVIHAEMIAEIIEYLRKEFILEEDTEITIESNPGTLSKEKLKNYRTMGINRLSIGLQSFSDTMLKNLGRIHSGKDFLKSFYMARECGFDNINVDLMFAIPGHTAKIWEDTLKKTVKLKPEHISFYSLQIEEGTPFYMMLKDDKISLISDDLDREMYHGAIRFLRDEGYIHYEISNACRPGFECRHNLKYWSMEDYLGIGPAASSFMEGVRFTEEPNPEHHVNSFYDNVSEFVFTGLRKRNGINLDEFQKKFGKDFCQVFADRREALSEYVNNGQLIKTGNMLKLSEEGIDISNHIMAEFV